MASLPTCDKRPFLPFYGIYLLPGIILYDSHYASIQTTEAQINQHCLSMFNVCCSTCVYYVFLRLAHLYKINTS